MSPTLSAFWIAANVCQGLWSFFFAAVLSIHHLFVKMKLTEPDNQEMITPSAVILSGVAVSLWGCIASAKDQSVRLCQIIKFN